jgi:multidrug efflux system membrane fusion protein
MPLETKPIEPARKRRRSLIILAGCGVVVLAGLVYWTQTPRADNTARSKARGPVPVSVVTVSHQDVPVYLTGLGTVQALFTVAIHSQVDGKLQDVFFQEGQRVKKGEVLAKIDPRLYQAALDQAKARKAMDEATLTAAEKDLARFRTLVQKNAETQQNLDLQQAKVDQAKASIQADNAAIETAQTNLDYTSIVASSDGRMGVRLVDPGNVVHANDQGAIAVLTQTQPTAVLFTLPAQTLDAVRAAMARGAVEVAAYDRDNSRLLSSGTLATIDNMIDQATATYKLKAMFANADETLWPGEFVNARLLLEIRKEAVVIPSVAVQRGPHGLFAWIVKTDNTVEPRPIATGTTTDERTIVTSGVAAGERVVTDGQYKLQTGAAVTIVDPHAVARGGQS